MSLLGALSIGRSALITQQAALAVTGNNISNAGDPNYTRQVAITAPGADQNLGNGVLIGTGVNLQSVSRQINEALNDRLRSAGSDAASAGQMQQWLTQIQSAFGALSGNDIDSQLTSFFGDWSSLANDPTNSGAQTAVMSAGQSLAGSIQGLNNQLQSISTSLDNQITTQASSANDLANQIAKLNQQIVSAQAGGGNANSLLDQRDAALSQLSQLVDITSSPQANGSTNVYIGSQILVQGSVSNGLATTRQTVNGISTVQLSLKSNGAPVTVSSGQIGALMQVQSQSLQPTLGQLNTMAGGLINELNKIHASGQGAEGFTNLTSVNAVADPTGSLASDSGLNFPITNGGFTVQVRDSTTGKIINSGTVNVKVGVAGTPDTSLNSLVSQLNGISNVQASVVNGHLKISTTGGNPNAEITFSDDTSGALASLGVNTFFTGSNASDIAVNSTISNNPSLIATGNTQANDVAQQIAAMGGTQYPSLGGTTISGSYQSMVNNIATQTADATTNSTAATQVQATLQAQQQSLSGVSQDEEAINLIQEQRAYQGAAQLISAIDQMMQTLLQM